MNDYSKFKTVLVKGFDKDEVLAYIQKKEDEFYAREAGFAKAIKSKDGKIEELKKRLVLKEEQKERLENEIEQKYKKYIDNYDRIGRLVFEAELKADKILKEAQQKADALVANAQSEADTITAEAQKKAEMLVNNAETDANARAAEVQREVNEKLAEGKKKYLAVQDEMNGILELMNQAQRSFMASYKEVHKIIKTVPSSLNEMTDEDPLDELPEEVLEEATAETTAEGVSEENFSEERDFPNFQEEDEFPVDDEDDFDIDTELDNLEKMLLSKDGSVSEEDSASENEFEKSETKDSEEDLKESE